MMAFDVWRWNDAKGGMRFAFPPYGPDRLADRLLQEVKVFSPTI
jgi:hypothetical protein